MIYDKMSNLDLYRLPAAVKTAVGRMQADSPVGRYELNDGIVCMVQEYRTRRQDLKAEAHRRFVDLQYIVSGSEEIGIATELPPTGDYNEEKDVRFFKPQAPGRIILAAGEFAVFFPQDIHMPGIGDDRPVKKAVFKLLRDEMYPAE